MNNNDRTGLPNQGTKADAKKEAYSPPKVTYYGDIRDITLGGSEDPGETDGFFPPPTPSP